MSDLISETDALEFTESLGQIVSGSWRQVALAKRLGVPKALGYTDTRDWVEDKLGGYVRMSIEDRREAVAELIENGESQRGAADVLGVDAATINRDLNHVADATTSAPQSASSLDSEPVDVADATEVGNPPPETEPSANLHNVSGLDDVEGASIDETTQPPESPDPESEREEINRKNRRALYLNLACAWGLRAALTHPDYVKETLRDHPGEFESTTGRTVEGLAEAIAEIQSKEASI